MHRTDRNNPIDDGYQLLLLCSCEVYRSPPRRHGYPADDQGPKPVFRRADIRRISALRRSPPDGFSVTSRAHLSPHWLEQGGEWRRAGAGTTRPAVATLLPVPTNGERDAPAPIRDVTENPSGGLLRKAGSCLFFRLDPAACVTDQKRFDRLSF